MKHHSHPHNGGSGTKQKPNGPKVNLDGDVPGMRKNPFGGKNGTEYAAGYGKTHQQHPKTAVPGGKSCAKC